MDGKTVDRREGERWNFSQLFSTLTYSTQISLGFFCGKTLASERERKIQLSICRSLNWSQFFITMKYMKNLFYKLQFLSISNTHSHIYMFYWPRVKKELNLNKFSPWKCSWLHTLTQKYVRSSNEESIDSFRKN